MGLAPRPRCLPAARTPSTEMRQNLFCAPVGCSQHPAPCTQGRAAGFAPSDAALGGDWSWASSHRGCLASSRVSGRKTVPKDWPSTLCWWPGVLLGGTSLTQPPAMATQTEGVTEGDSAPWALQSGCAETQRTCSSSGSLRLGWGHVSSAGCDPLLPHASAPGSVSV